MAPQLHETAHWNPEPAEGTEQAPCERGGLLSPSSRAGRGWCSHGALRSERVASAVCEAALGLTRACTCPGLEGCVAPGAHQNAGEHFRGLGKGFLGGGWGDAVGEG